MSIHDSIDYAMGTPQMPNPTELPRAVGALVAAEMRQTLIDWISDKLTHATVLSQGRVGFRIAVVREFGPMWGNNRAECDRFADIAFNCLDRAWKDQYPEMSPGYFLDKVHVPSPLSEKAKAAEIEDAWELEIAGDERHMREHYEGSARTRKGKFLGLKHGQDALIEDDPTKKT